MRSTLAVAFCVSAVLFMVGCGETPAPAPKGYVSGAEPALVSPGGSVTISGSGMGAKGKVRTADGKAFSTSHWGAGTIVAQVPADQPAGPLELVVEVDGQAIGQVSLKVAARPARLVSADKETGTVGMAVTVKGERLGSQDKAKLLIHGHEVKEVTQWTDTQITFKIPPLTETGAEHAIWVESGGVRSNALPFAITPPFASEMVPDPAPPEKVVRVKGRDFGEEKGTVVFGAQKLEAEVLAWANTEIELKLPKGLSGEVQLRVVNKNGASFPLQVYILPPPEIGKLPTVPAQQLAIALDGADMPFILGYNPAGNQLALVTWGRQGWDSQTALVQKGTTTGAMPKAAPELEDKIKKLMDESRGQKIDSKALEKKVRELVDKETAAVVSVKVNVSAAGHFPRVALDAHRTLHVAMYDSGTQKIVYGSRPLAEDEWTFQYVVADETAKEGMFCDLALDAKGLPHVVYMETGKRQLYHAVMKDGKFVTELVDPEQDVGMLPSLALDAKGQARAAYLDFGKFDLKYAEASGGQYKVDRVEDAGWTGDVPSLLFDEKDGPAIAYAFRDEKGEQPMGLRVAAKKGGAWKVETVEQGPGIGVQPIIRRDAQGRYHLLCIDQTQKALRYAVRAGADGAWKKQVVKIDNLAVEQMPQGVAMAVGTDGAARVVFAGADKTVSFKVLLAP